MKSVILKSNILLAIIFVIQLTNVSYLQIEEKPQNDELFLAGYNNSIDINLEINSENITLDASLAQYYHLDEVHRHTNGTGARILIIDKPIYKDHSYLYEHLDYDKCVLYKPGIGIETDYIDDVDWNDDTAHGTRIAGTVAQVAPGATIMGLGILDEDYFGDALRYLKDNWNYFNPDIITVSIYGSTTYSDSDAEDDLKFFAEIKGAIVTLCVGNVWMMNDEVVEENVAWPANVVAYKSGIIGVGSVIDYGEFAGTHAEHSRMNSDSINGLEITAPGVNILTTDAHPNNLVEVSGTSYATPIIAALGALAYEIYGTLVGLEEFLYKYCWNPSDLFPEDWYYKYGHGIANCPGMFIPTFDTDNDGLSDQDEIDINNLISDGTLDYRHYVDFKKFDTDGDFLNDGDEIYYIETNCSWLCNSYPNMTDSDNDIISDGSEVNIYGTNPMLLDTDGDGLNDSIELFYYGTNPLDVDTDNDGIWDGDEVLTFGASGGGGYWPQGYTNDYVTDPLNSDTDEDGISDYDEIFICGTNPTLDDSDEDLMPDLWELDNNLNPNVPDASDDEDNDGLTNYQEFLENTDPNDFDTDNDNLPDGWEVSNNLNPLISDSTADPDNDDLTNYEEFSAGTDPQDSDSDDDGMPDGWEIDYALNPLTDDATGDEDGDGLYNIDEYTNNCDPNDSDSDDDGLNDKEEILNGCDPNDSDSDNDGWNDYFEVYTSGTDPADADSDNDGKNDKTEYLYWKSRGKSDATAYAYCLDSDVDNDGLTDGYEINIGVDPLDNDCDNDGLLDGLEVETYDTDPEDPDSDDDGYTDLYEVINGTDPNDASDYPGGGFGW